MNNSSKYNIFISYQNEIRTITIKNQTRIVDIARKSIENFDLNINEIAGIYFYFYDANVYFGDSEETELNKNYIDFIDVYNDDINRIFTIESISNTNRDRRDIEDFKNKYLLFTTNTSNNYYHRPIINITTNNYNNTVEENTRRNRNIYEYYFDIFRQPNNEPSQEREQNTETGNTNNIWSTLFQNGRTHTNSNLNSYNNFLNSLNSLINQNYGENLLSLEEISRLPVGRYDFMITNNLIMQECTQCNITLEEFRPETSVMALPCRHGFQESAIRYWLLNNGSNCPVCRANVRIN